MAHQSKPGRITPELEAQLQGLAIENPSDESLVKWLLANASVVTEGQVKWLQTLVKRGGARFTND
jgi:hypothetical protein